MKMQPYDYHDQNQGYYDPHDPGMIPYIPDLNNAQYLNVGDGYAVVERQERQRRQLRSSRSVSATAGVNTAAGKRNCFSTEPEINPDEWKQKNQQDWTPKDVLHWVANVANIHNFSYEKVNANEFNISGQTLLALSKQDFITRDPDFGALLFNFLHGTQSSSHSANYMSAGPSDRGMSSYMSYNDSGMDMGSQNTTYAESHHSAADSESVGGSDSELDLPPRKIKRPPGRPPSNKTKAKAQKKTGRLWEFIRNLLHDPETCPSVICWEDHDEGVFRFVKSEKVAKIWGKRKNNEKMNYEKLSRAMRYYYKGKVFEPVLGRKLVYKFGPNAKGWRSENPNFSTKPDQTLQDSVPVKEEALSHDCVSVKEEALSQDCVSAKEETLSEDSISVKEEIPFPAQELQSLIFIGPVKLEQNN